MKSTQHNLVNRKPQQTFTHTHSISMADSVIRMATWGQQRLRGSKKLSRRWRWKSQFSIILCVPRDEHCELVPSLCVSCQLSPCPFLSHHPRTRPWKCSVCVWGKRTGDALLVVAKNTHTSSASPCFRHIFVVCQTRQHFIIVSNLQCWFISHR